MPGDPLLWQKLTAGALLGTERAGESVLPPTSEESSLGGLMSRLAAQDREAKFLAAAGVTAFWLRAGRAAEKVATAPDAAAEHEENRVCGVRAEAHLLRMLNGEQRQVLPEFLSELAATQQIVPAHLLADLLDLAAAQRSYREGLTPVIGHRGAWLAAQNPDWSFVLGETLDPATWETGSFDERVALLRHLRQTSPTAGRELVERTWKDDSPEHRAAFIELFAVGLDAGDEPLLETSLDDRRKEVRRVAAELLARLPESALVQRMIERTTPLVQCQAGKKGILRGKALTLEITLPEVCDKAMIRDGIEQKAGRSGYGERAWWLMQMLSAVPPRTWSTRFDQKPQTLVELAHSTEWKRALLNGWATAAVRHRDKEWAIALLSGWIAHLAPDAAADEQPSPELLAGLASVVPQNELEGIIASSLKAAKLSADHPLLAVAQHLPARWGKPLSEMVLNVIESHLRSSGANVSWSLLQMTADRFALRISPEIVPRTAALLDHQPPDRPPVYVSAVKRFVETLRFRHDMLKEIHA